MIKIASDIALLLLIGSAPYFLAWARLNGSRSKEALYEGARRNAGIRS